MTSCSQRGYCFCCYDKKDFNFEQTKAQELHHHQERPDMVIFLKVFFSLLILKTTSMIFFSAAILFCQLKLLNFSTISKMSKMRNFSRFLIREWLLSRFCTFRKQLFPLSNRLFKGCLLEGRFIFENRNRTFQIVFGRAQCHL